VSAAGAISCARWAVGPGSGSRQCWLGRMNRSGKLHQPDFACYAWPRAFHRALPALSGVCRHWLVIRCCRRSVRWPRTCHQPLAEEFRKLRYPTAFLGRWANSSTKAAGT